MRKIFLLLFVAAVVASCKKNEVSDYPKKMGEIAPPEWMYGEWKSTDGNADLGLVVSEDNIIKDGVNQKETIKGLEVIFEDVFKYSQDQYIYVYQLKEPIEISLKYSTVTTTTVYNQDGTIAKDKDGKERIQSEKKEIKNSYVFKFFKSHYTKNKNELGFKAVLVDGALAEQTPPIHSPYSPSKKETEIKENEIKLKKVVVEETTDFSFESKGISLQDYKKMVTPRKYRK